MLAALAVLAGVAGAAAAPPRAPLPARDVQPMPGTSFAARAAAGRAEADTHRAQHPLVLEPTWYGAANFAAIAANPWKVVHQDITVDVDAAVPSLTTDIILTVRAAKDGISDLGFFIPIADSVSTTTDDGTALAHDFAAMGGDVGILTLHLTAPLSTQADTKLRVSRKAKLTCGAKGLGLKSCTFNSTFSSVVLYDYDLRPSDFAHAPFPSDLHVITPIGKVAAAPGLPSGPSTLPDGRLVWHFQQVEPTSNAGFSIAAYKPVVTPATGSLPNIRVFSVPSVAGHAPDMTKLAQDILTFYGQSFVPFPWKELNLIQLADDFGGGYAPLSTAFLLGEAFGIGPNDPPWEGMAELIAHELGHQWWGNLVEPAGAGDVSLSESLAEFSSCLFTEKAFENRSQILTNNLSYVYSVPAAQDMAITSGAVYSSAKYFDIIYHKGSAVLDMLRRELGDDAMNAGLKEYVAQYHHDFARVQHLRAAMEKASGRDLGNFFDQWFNRPGAIQAELATRVTAQDGAWKVRLRIRQLDDKPRSFQLQVAVDFQDGEKQDFKQDIVPGADGSTIVEWTVPKAPARVRVDPQRLLVRAFSLGTPGDANLSGLCDGADLVDLALRNGRRILAKHKTQTYFFPDTSWNELYDITSDYMVNPDDAVALGTWLGTEAEAF